MNSNDPNDSVQGRGQCTQLFLCQGVVSWEGPFPPSPENDLRWYRVTCTRVTYRSQPCPFWLLQKLTLSWLKPGQRAYLPREVMDYLTGQMKALDSVTSPCVL